MDFRSMWTLFFSSHLNLPYLWAGDDFIGYDCNGLVQEGYKMFGADPKGDQTAHAYFEHFSKPENGTAFPWWGDSKPFLGDMVYYGRRIDGKIKIGHIAVCVNDFAMFEAGGGGRKTTTVAKAAEQNAWVRIRPIQSRKDFFTIIRPKLFMNNMWSPGYAA